MFPEQRSVKNLPKLDAFLKNTKKKRNKQKRKQLHLTFESLRVSSKVFCLHYNSTYFENVLQEVGPLHPAADPSVRDPLHGVRLLPREREQEGASGV